MNAEQFEALCRLIEGYAEIHSAPDKYRRTIIADKFFKGEYKELRDILVVERKQ